MSLKDEEEIRNVKQTHFVFVCLFFIHLFTRAYIVWVFLHPPPPPPSPPQQTHFE
jgi:hypothetical protein